MQPWANHFHFAFIGIKFLLAYNRREEGDWVVSGGTSLIYVCVCVYMRDTHTQKNIDIDLYFMRAEDGKII